MVEILAAKKALRRSIKAVCAALPATQIQSESARVAQRLFARDNWKSATKVCAFCSMPGELDTTPILEAAFAANKRVFLPRVEDVKARDMAMVEAFSMADIDAFPRSNWGIAEPPRDDSREDALDARVHVLTSYDDAGYLQIVPHANPRAPRTLWLSFWAEVHYNSVREAC